MTGLRPAPPAAGPITVQQNSRRPCSSSGAACVCLSLTSFFGGFCFSVSHVVSRSASLLVTPHSPLCSCIPASRWLFGVARCDIGDRCPSWTCAFHIFGLCHVPSLSPCAPCFPSSLASYLITPLWLYRPVVAPWNAVVCIFCDGGQIRVHRILLLTRVYGSRASILGYFVPRTSPTRKAATRSCPLRPAAPKRTNTPRPQDVTGPNDAAAERLDGGGCACEGVGISACVRVRLCLCVWAAKHTCRPGRDLQGCSFLPLHIVARRFWPPPLYNPPSCPPSLLPSLSSFFR